MFDLLVRWILTSSLTSKVVFISCTSQHCSFMWLSWGMALPLLNDRGTALPCIPPLCSVTQCCEVIKTHTHTHTFNSPLSGTTRVGPYQKGKNYLDFTEARESEWQWHQLGHMQVCTLLQTDNHATPHRSVFYRPDALRAAQPTVSKHWRHEVIKIRVIEIRI